MAALTLLIQESALHNLSSLDMLIGMVSRKGRREALMALGMVEEKSALQWKFKHLFRIQYICKIE